MRPTPQILYSTYPNTICSSNRAEQHICMSMYASSQPVPHNQDSSTFTITHFGALCLAAKQDEQQSTEEENTLTHYNNNKVASPPPSSSPQVTYIIQ
mmetsp:Transcript_43123/g.63299  ORF Transcript_43123/g.63299 Transcript_43123/m.63299 type:complete len:97 (+) Transcript_43123:62-352(+)